MVSFRIDWLDLLAVQGTLKSLLHHHSSTASILWRSVFFMVQLSHPYMTTGKTIALTRLCQQSDLEPYISPKIHLPRPIQSLQSQLKGPGSDPTSHQPCQQPMPKPHDRVWPLHPGGCNHTSENRQEVACQNREGSDHTSNALTVHPPSDLEHSRCSIYAKLGRLWVHDHLQ